MTTEVRSGLAFESCMWSTTAAKGLRPVPLSSSNLPATGTLCFELWLARFSQSLMHIVPHVHRILDRTKER